MKIPVVPIEVWRELYAAMDTWGRLAPWKYMSDGEVFGVEVPVHSQAVLPASYGQFSNMAVGYGCVLGSLGEVIALCVYRGAESMDEINKILQEQIVESGLKAAPQGAREAAQDMIYRAWEMKDPEERIAQARRALAVDPDCADAYNVLAECEARTLEDAAEYYRKAVEAGERSLGPERFKRDAGHFWEKIDTRPYMRARLDLALRLWELGRRDESLGHMNELLRLNPADNQGIRYVLACDLAEEGKFEELERLLDQPLYKEDIGAQWLYPRALLAFRQSGDSPEARKALKKAASWNRHVPDFLTGRKALWNQTPPHYSPGAEDEAVIAAFALMKAWRRVPGAIDWLKNRMAAADFPKAGYYDPCPCGSGKKYKKCCLA